MLALFGFRTTIFPPKITSLNCVKRVHYADPLAHYSAGLQFRDCNEVTNATVRVMNYINVFYRMRNALADLTLDCVDKYAQK